MSEKPTAVTIAAIDVGTNSVHMVIAKVSSTGFDVLASEKEVVRLGEGAEGMDHLTFPAIERGVNALRRMKQIADAHSAVIAAVATSAVREATNRDEFLTAVRESVGIEIEVVSGAEEARLIQLGVSRSLDLRNDVTLTIDIGGGSTEFCISNRGRIEFAQSVKMGAVRMTDAFMPGGVISDAAIRKLRSKVRSALAPLAHDIASIGFTRVVVSSGTSETMARIVASHREKVLPLNFNGFSFSNDELNRAVAVILNEREPQQRRAIAGMDPKRADIIAAGSIILDEIARALKIRQLEYSDFALREGVLVDAAQRLHIMDAELSDAGYHSALRLAERCSVDLAHGEHVAQLGIELLHSIAKHYEVDTSLERLVRAAGLLTRAGNAISYSRYHLHSYYIIRNADLVGFTDDEVEVIAQAARYHRKGTPKASHAAFSQLSLDRQHDVELIAAILRVATGLDRSHDQSISGVKSVVLRQGILTIAVQSASKNSELVELNLATAQSRVEMLGKYLGDTIELRLA